MGRKKKACANCAKIEAGDILGVLNLGGMCPSCEKDWSPRTATVGAEDDPEPPAFDDEGDDVRAGCIEDLGAMLQAYAVSVEVGSAATWLQAREVVQAARRLLEAEDALAPRGAEVPATG